MGLSESERLSCFHLCDEILNEFRSIIQRVQSSTGYLDKPFVSVYLIVLSQLLIQMFSEPMISQEIVSVTDSGSIFQQKVEVVKTTV
jgi:hypothetical protein